MLATEFFQRDTGFCFFQDVYDLAFRILRLLYIDRSWLYFAMSCPLLNGPILGDGYPPIPKLNNSITQPRTAIGYSNNGRFLYLVVVDGRQPFYSEGITLNELAHLMISLGAKMP